MIPSNDTISMYVTHTRYPTPRTPPTPTRDAPSVT